MSNHQTPIVVLGLTICAYWFCVGVMIMRVRRNAQGVRRVLLPSHPLERLMWFLWLPLVPLWMLTPWAALTSWGSAQPLLTEPYSRGQSGALLFLRWVASSVGVVCLLLSIWAWRHMGRYWRMGIDAAQRSPLLVHGPFAKVRHPIYALSILLMVCSVIVLPVPLMGAIAVVHICLMLLKVRNEERFLSERHGQLYADYCARTCRFLPSLRVGYKISPPSPTNAVSRAVGSEHRPEEPGHQAGWALNAFQRAMLLWEEVHPYNAIHALRVAGPADPATLRAAIESACRQARIGTLRIHEETQTYRYGEPGAVPLDVLPETDHAERTLAEIIFDGLNTRWADEGRHPLRWMVFNESGAEHHHVILVYRHAAADASAIELLLSAVMNRYLGCADLKASTKLSPMPPATTTGAGLLSIPSLLWGFVRGLTLYFRFRHMHKMPDEAQLGDETAVILRSLPEDVLAGLAETYRPRGIGVNDIFVAALAAAIADRTPHRRNRRHRHQIAIGTIASTRSASWRSQDPAFFGVCLSDQVVILKNPDLPFDQLLSRVVAQTRRRKTSRRPERAVSAMQGFFIRNVWPLLDIPNHRRSYRKLLPICGGVSTYSVSTSHFGPAADRITRYLRACPPGPATPLALAPTLFKGRLELTLVYRMSCLPPEKAEDLMDGVCDRVLSLLRPSGSGKALTASSPSADAVLSGNHEVPV